MHQDTNWQTFSVWEGVIVDNTCCFRYTCCVLGLQHYLTMFGATVSIPFILCPLLCIREDDPARGYIISTILFVSGLVTLLQVILGCRLPIIQGGTFSFLVPTIAILSLDRFQCPEGLMTSDPANFAEDYDTEEER